MPIGLSCYTMNPASYDKLIKENVTKTYKKSSDSVAEKLDGQSASIAKRLKLGDRIEKLAKKDAFITMKDHKPGFNDHPTCRLINPSKSEIGVVIASTSLMKLTPPSSAAHKSTSGRTRPASYHGSTA